MALVEGASTIQRLGRYQIVQELARGSFGDVFLATPPPGSGLPSRLAIKRLLPELVDRPDRVNSFISEARIGAALQHQNIVRVYEFAQDEGHYFLVMEYVDGPSLESILLKMSQAGRAMPVSFCLDMVAQICLGLAYAHSATAPDGRPLGLVHRDLKPGNIMLAGDKVKILDFSIARASTNLDRTATGIIKGSFGYMAPEQASGEVDLGPACDVFAVGLIFLEAALGEPVYNQRSDTERWMAARQGRVSAAVEKALGLLPQGRDLFDAMLATSPAARATTGRILELVEQLRPSAPPGPLALDVHQAFQRGDAEGTALGETRPWLKVKSTRLPSYSTGEILRKMGAKAAEAQAVEMAARPASTMAEDVENKETVRISREAVRAMIREAQAARASEESPPTPRPRAQELSPAAPAPLAVEEPRPPSEEGAVVGKDERQGRMGWRTKASSVPDPFMPMNTHRTRKEALAPRKEGGEAPAPAVADPPAALAPASAEAPPPPALVVSPPSAPPPVTPAAPAPRSRALWVGVAVVVVVLVAAAVMFLL